MSNAVSLSEHRSEDIVKQYHSNVWSPLRRQMIEAFDNGEPVYVVSFDFPWSVSDHSQPEKGVWTEWQKEQGIMMEVDGQQHVVFSDRHDYHQDIEIHPERLSAPPKVVREATLQDISIHEFTRRAEQEAKLKQKQEFAAKKEAVERENAVKWTEGHDDVVNGFGRLKAVHEKLKGVVKALPDLKQQVSLERFLSDHQREPASERVGSNELYPITLMQSSLRSRIAKGEKLLEMLEKQQKVAPDLVDGVTFSDGAARQGFDFNNNRAVVEMMQQVRRNAMLLDKGYMVSIDADDSRVLVNVVNTHLETVLHASVEVDSIEESHSYTDRQYFGQYDECKVDTDITVGASICGVGDEPEWECALLGKKKEQRDMPEAFSKLLAQFSEAEKPLIVVTIDDISHECVAEGAEPSSDADREAIDDFLSGFEDSVPLELNFEDKPIERDVAVMQLLEKHCPDVVDALQVYASKSQYFGRKNPSQEFNDDLTP